MSQSNPQSNNANNAKQSSNNQQDSLANIKEYFINATHQAGIKTRIVPCVLELEFASLSTLNQDKVAKEYQILGEQGNDIISQAMHSVNKESDTSNAIIIELLAQIYQKVARIERTIMKESSNLIALEKTTSISAFGHGVVCCEKECFAVGEEYYARFVLPNLLQRIIGIYAKSITPQIIQFTSIHSSDAAVLDNFIAHKEMEQLREQRTK